MAYPFRGGERVRVVYDYRPDGFIGKALIVVAPCSALGLRQDAVTVQCFDPETGYIWPFAPAQLSPVSSAEAR